MLARTIGEDPPSLAGLTSEQLVSCCDRGCTAEESGGSNQRSPPVLIVHAAGDQTPDPSDSYLLAASHSGDECRLLLCYQGLITLCRSDIITGILVDLLCGIVGTMDDPVSGRPSHAGERLDFFASS